MPRVAHAVRAELVRLGDARNHDSAGAYAEGVQVRVPFCLQRIVRGAEELRIVRVAILPAVHLLLRLLNPQAELERLLTERHPWS